MIREIKVGDFGRFDYVTTGNKVVGCAWMTSLLQRTKHYQRSSMIKNPVYIKTNPDYVYVAEIVDWTDGDTVDVDIWIFLDYGFHDYDHKLKKHRVRLMGIDTPERGKPGYKEATAFNASNFPPGTEVRVKTYKMPSGYNNSEKYGRYLADIFSADMEFNLNEALVASGLAVSYDGGKKLTQA